MTGSTKVVQITNIAPQATKDQMQSLFGSVGKIDEIRLYPTVRDVSCPVNSRICYVKYIDSSSVNVAQHLTNTVFIDRALIVIPVTNGTIPDEYRALEMSSNGTIVPGLQNQNYKLPDEVVNRIDGMVPNQVVKTDDPKLVEAGLPEYPALPVNYDARKIEETRRTIVVLDCKDEWKMEGLLEFFKPAGEVKYARWAEYAEGTRMAMIEFCEQKMVIAALKMQGQEYDGEPINLYHSTQPITKPEAKSNEAAQKEIEEAMSIVKEAQSMISAAIDPVIGLLGSKKSVTRSRSRSRKRSKTREKSRSRRRSRSKYSRSRSRSRSKRHRSRSKEHRRRRSRSREHRRRSRSRSRKRRSRSHDRRRRSYSRDRKRSHRKDDRRRKSRSGSRSSSSRKKHKERRRSRSRSRSSKHRTPSVERTSRSRDHKEKKHEKKRDKEKALKRISEEKPVRDYDAEEKIGTEDDTDKASSRRSPSPPVPKAADDMDISNSP